MKSEHQELLNEITQIAEALEYKIKKARKKRQKLEYSLLLCGVDQTIAEMKDFINGSYDSPLSYE